MGKISRVTPSWWGFSLGKSGTDFEAFTALVHSMNQTQVWEKSVGLGLQKLNRDFRDSRDFSIVLQYDCNQIFASTSKIPLFPLFLLFF